METKKNALILLPWVENRRSCCLLGAEKIFYNLYKTLLLLTGSREDFYKLKKICSRMLNGCSRVKKQTGEQFFNLKNRHFYRFAPHNPYNNNNIIIIYRGLYIYGAYMGYSPGAVGSKNLAEVAA